MDECVKDITVMACGAVEWSTNNLFYYDFMRHMIAVAMEIGKCVLSS